jgi:predicted permease
VTLSKLIFNIFQPALLLVNVATTLADPKESMRTLCIIPLFALLQITIGGFVARNLLWRSGVPENSMAGREIKMGCSFANSGPLPLLFVDSLFHADPAMASRAVAFVSFYLLGWSPAFWTIGRNILSPISSSGYNGRSGPNNDQYRMGGGMNIEYGNNDDYGIAAETTTPPRSPLAQKLEQENEDLKNQISQLAGSGPIFGGDGNGAWAKLQRTTFLGNPTTKRVLSPPVLGCIIGAIIGAVPFLTNLCLGSTAPLRPLTDGVRTLGQAYLPAVILTLAGTLHSSLRKERVEAAASFEQYGGFVRKQFNRRMGEVSLSFTLGILSLARFVIMPAIGLATVLFGVRIGIIPRDSLLVFGQCI